MGNPRNADLYNKVMMYLDNELSQEAERDLLLEIRKDPKYLELLGREKSFREFIKQKIHRRKVSPSLVQTIKDKIRVAPI